MAGLGDLIVVVEDLATYQAAVNAGKTAPSVMYLILAERQVYFNSELWSKAPEEGGGGDIDTSNLATKEDLGGAEYVTADVLIRHHERQNAFETEVRASYLSKAALDAEVERLNRIIIENEYITATALADLNNKLNQ